MSGEDSWAPLGWTLLVLFLCACSCGKGYSIGYDEHRREVCERSGGAWMQRVLDEDRRVCIGGRR